MKHLLVIIGILCCQLSFADQANLDKKIWAHQAILATFQISHDSYIADQKEIARYFTSKAWQQYLQGLNKVKYQDFIAKNYYRVSAVALKPVQLAVKPEGYWQATMPVLIQYKNPQYEQFQTLSVTIQFHSAKPGLGIQGYQLVSYQSKQLDKLCKCVIKKGKRNLFLKKSPG